MENYQEKLKNSIKGASVVFIDAAKELPPASNHYFDIADFRDQILRIEPKKQRTPHQ